VCDENACTQLLTIPSSIHTNTTTVFLVVLVGANGLFWFSHMQSGSCHTHDESLLLSTSATSLSSLFTGRANGGGASSKTHDTDDALHADASTHTHAHEPSTGARISTQLGALTKQKLAQGSAVVLDAEGQRVMDMRSPALPYDLHPHAPPRQFAAFSSSTQRYNFFLPFTALAWMRVNITPIILLESRELIYDEQRVDPVFEWVLNQTLSTGCIIHWLQPRARDFLAFSQNARLFTYLIPCR
jgi:hypothetical protein